jgi:hypothetical protein
MQQVPYMKTPFEDMTIPVLTDVISSPANAAVPLPDAASVQTQWQQWQHEIHENVLQNLLTNITPGLAQQVEEHLSVAVMQLSDQITQQIKVGLEEALRETVSRAVAEEMEKFKL